MEQKETKKHTLSDCPEWVRNHSDFAPWQTGRQKVLEKIRGWNRKFAPQLCDESFVQKLDEYDNLVTKLLTCLVFHWEKAGKKFSHAKVVENLDRGIKGDGNKTNGRPLFDLIFAAAFCEEHEKAKTHYVEQLLPQLKGKARQFHTEKSLDCTSDWISSFYIYLSEPGESGLKPMERTFNGFWGIVTWLRAALNNHLLTEYRKQNVKKRRLPQDPLSSQDEDKAVSAIDGLVDENDSPFEEVMLKELAEQTRDALSKALATLGGDDRLRLRLFYSDSDDGDDSKDRTGKGMQNQEIARIFGERDDTTTRRRKQAERQLMENFRKNLENSALFSAIQDRLPQLMDELADILSQFFKSEGGER